MRHRRSNKILGRTSSERRALGRALVCGVLLSREGRILTTRAKAKWVRRTLERVCSIGSRALGMQSGSVEHVNAMRKLSALIGGRGMLGNVVRAGWFGRIAATGGVVRVVGAGKRRLGDSGHYAVLELVRRDGA